MLLEACPPPPSVCLCCPTTLDLSEPPDPPALPVSPSLAFRAETDCGPDNRKLQICPVCVLLKYLTFHDGVSGLASPDAEGLEHLLESVLGLVLGREDESGGLLAAVTHPDGGQELLEVGTLGCDLQSGGGGNQAGTPVDANIVKSGHN